MKKVYLLALALTLPIQANAVNNESVYAWGEWAQNIQPAAGPVAIVTPSPVAQPKIDFRQNENPSFNRIDLSAQAIAQAAADAAAQAAADAAAQAVVVPAAPIVPNQPQLPEIVSAPVDAPAINPSDLPTTTPFSL